MSEVRIRENESLESALKRFKRPALSARKRLKPPVSASGDFGKTPFCKKKGFFFFFFVQIHFYDRFFML